MTPAQSQSPSTAPDSLRQHRLANGLRINLEPDASLPLVSVDVSYQAGSDLDPPGRTGLAHFAEHMAFRGSRHIPPGGHERQVEKAGGSTNAKTLRHRTSFSLTLPRHWLPLAFWLESERMGWLAPAVDEEELEKQRRIILNERRQRIDNKPYGRAGERLQELLFPESHPSSRPIIGYQKDIQSVALEDVRSYFQDRFRPDNAVLTVAGDFSPQEALPLLESYFGELPASAGPGDGQERDPEAASQECRRDHLRDRVRLPRVYLGFRAAGRGMRAWYAANLLLTALCGGRASPLFQRLILGRQSALDVVAAPLPGRLLSGVIIAATARPGVALDALEQALTEELARAASQLCEDDLEAARNRLLTVHYDQLQVLESRAREISRWTLRGEEPGRIRQTARLYRRITLDEVGRVAAQWLEDQPSAVVSVEPQGASL